MQPKLRTVVAQTRSRAQVNDAHTMVRSAACTVPSPLSAAHLHTLPFYLHRRLKVKATANPHTLRIRVIRCPTGLQQWSEPCPEILTFPGQDSGLATPNIPLGGRSAPQTNYMGRRHHFRKTMPVRLPIASLLLLMCSLWVARPIFAVNHTRHFSFTQLPSPQVADPHSRPFSSLSLSSVVRPSSFDSFFGHR